MMQVSFGRWKGQDEPWGVRIHGPEAVREYPIGSTHQVTVVKANGESSPETVKVVKGGGNTVFCDKVEPERQDPAPRQQARHSGHVCELDDVGMRDIEPVGVWDRTNRQWRIEWRLRHPERFASRTPCRECMPKF